MKTFPIGGVHPSDNKLSRAVAVERFALPDEVRIPLAQHIGAPAVAKVAKGDKGARGAVDRRSREFHVGQHPRSGFGHGNGRRPATQRAGGCVR